MTPALTFVAVTAATYAIGVRIVRAVEARRAARIIGRATR